MEEMRHGPGKAHDNHLGDRVDDPLIDRLHWIIRQAIRVLAVLMVPVFFVVIRRLFPASGHEAPHATSIGSAATDAAAAAALHKEGR